jgi:hypothetical protein
LLCDLNYQVLNPTVRAVFDLTEQWEQQRQRRFEADVVQLIREGKESAAVDHLQKFTDENCKRIENEYKMLNQILPTMLESVGIEYVYKDYLQDWSTRKGVPLPWK